MDAQQMRSIAAALKRELETVNRIIALSSVTARAGWIERRESILDELSKYRVYDTKEFCMKPSSHCKALIKTFEGLRTKAYPDDKGVPTIGYGHTQGVRLGDTCTEAQADKWFDADLDEAAKPIIAMAARDGVELSQNELDALTSFTFNLGIGNLSRSTLWKQLKAGYRIGAANEFLKWDKVRIGGVLVAKPGLTRRRAAERALFLGD